MAQTTGTLKQDNKVVLTEITITLEEGPDLSTGIWERHGSFELPNNTFVKPGDVFNLKLVDGRSGQIIITQQHRGGKKKAPVDTILFDVTGNLAY